MRLTATRRAIAALLAVWFTLVSVDPMWLHACPMHGGGSLRVENHGALDAAGPQHAAHHGTTERSAPETPHEGHTCVCLGDCQSGGAAPLPATALSVPTHDIIGAPASPPVFWRVHRAVRLAYLLPYAHAPPTALI